MDSLNWRSKARAAAAFDLVRNTIGLTFVFILSGLIITDKLPEYDVPQIKATWSLWLSLGLIAIAQLLSLFSAIRLIKFTEEFCEMKESVSPAHFWFLVNLIDLTVSGCAFAAQQIWIGVFMTAIIRILFIYVAYNLTREINARVSVLSKGNFV